MKIYTLFLAGLTISPLTTFAKDITPAQARDIAAKYISVGEAKKMRQFKAPLAATPDSMNDRPNFYAINDNKGKGFVLIAGDDCISPVLGYSHEGSIDLNNLPPQLKDWLCAVSDDITAMRKAGGGVAKTAAGSSEDSEPTIVVNPLIKTKWNQQAPYNDLTPTINNQHTLTGCVATSLAQVLNYYKWPQKGTGSVNYATPNYDTKTMNIDFTQSVYDWDNMLDNYNTKTDGTPEWNDAQGKAVATLMRDLGAAIHMEYGLKSSGSWTYDIANTINKYFGYKAVMYYNYEYNAKEWIALIKKFIDAGDPLSYAGQDHNLGGHQYVIDGYDSNDYLHINWGWSGSGDGYYTFSKLGYSTASFNIGMDFVHLTPCRNGEPTNAEEQTGTLVLPTLLNAENEEVEKLEGTGTSLPGSLKAGFQHASYKKFDGKARLVLTSEDGAAIAILREDDLKTTSPNEKSTIVYPLAEVIPANLPNGSYRLKLEVKDTKSDGTPFDTWKTCPFLAYRIDMTIADGKTSINLYRLNFEPVVIKSLTFDKSPVTFGENLTWTAKIDTKNGGDHLWDNLILFLAKNGDKQGSHMELGHTLFSAFGGLDNTVSHTIDCVTADAFEEGTYTVLPYVGSSKELTPVEIEGGPVTLTLKADPDPTRPYIVNAALSANTSDGETIKYDIADGKVIDIDMSKSIDELVFDYDFDWYMSAITPENFNYTISLTQTLDDKTSLAKSETTKGYNKFSKNFSLMTFGEPFEESDYGKVVTWKIYFNAPYCPKLAEVYKLDGSPLYIYTRCTDSTVGINEIVNNATVTERYDLQGCRISAPVKGLNIVRMSDGKVKKVVVR